MMGRVGRDFLFYVIGGMVLKLLCRFLGWAGWDDLFFGTGGTKNINNKILTQKCRNLVE
jgi:hypothetical protein